MKTKALSLVAAVALAGAVAITFPTMLPARAAELGGYTMSADASPIVLHIYEPLIPIPAEPQLELDLSYSRAKAATGPTGQAVSSFVWPGDGVAYGLPELLKNPDGKYPAKVDAAHPGGPKTASQEPFPGTAMKSHADEKTVEASSTFGSHSTDALPIGGLLPVPIPVPAILIAMEGVASHSKTEITGTKATATSYAAAGTLSLLGGIVEIDGLRTEASATSDGTKGSSTSKVVWNSITLAGQTFEADQDGVKSPAGVFPIPKIPAQLTDRLDDLGLAIAEPKVDTQNKGEKGKVTGRGLTITLDTAVLRNRLGLSALLDPLLALIPAELRNQLTPWLNLGPKLVFILGSASAEAEAAPAFTGDTPPSGGAGAGAGAGAGGTGTGGAGTDPGATGETPPQPVAADGFPIFGGVPYYLVALGILLAAGMSYGLRHFAAGMFGGSGCDLGVSQGIPNLRER